ncbi:MAG: class I SAM-dependent methyltransferase [Chloroflexi bacterium]|nr:class I SAM-dependent methyltransferase [Chloroflexota bacterium]
MGDEERAERFASAYAGIPPWDIGHAQREIIGLEEAGEITGAVLDVGCGTGENALFLAGRGHEVWGIDSAPTAIEKARAKAAQRGLKVSFQVGNVLELEDLNKTFDTVIDSGLFHTLSDRERTQFAESLASVMHEGGKYFMLCFSDLQPGTQGPRRVTQAEIRQTFQKGWRVNWIRAATMESNFDGIRAWLASISKGEEDDRRPSTG